MVTSVARVTFLFTAFVALQASAQIEQTGLPDDPGFVPRAVTAGGSQARVREGWTEPPFGAGDGLAAGEKFASEDWQWGKARINGAQYAPPARERYHWTGLLLQTLAYDGIQNGVRIATARQSDLHILLDKPFWRDYFSSLDQFNMRRWNDGDDFGVNYVGHPFQGAITGFLEVQNNPQDRELEFSLSKRYFASRGRALLWTTAVSTFWEIGPLGEAAIFNEGGFTYPIRCSGAACMSPNATYTNNTGWVDFIVTPVIGTGLLIFEDYVDTFTKRAQKRHLHVKKYTVLRGAANPNRGFANMLRGRCPWYRDGEGEETRETISSTSRSLEGQPESYLDVFPHYTTLSLRTNQTSCMGCKATVTGGGVEMGFRISRWTHFDVDYSYLPRMSPAPSYGIGGSLVLANFGVRSGYEGKHFAAKLTLAPGLASYSSAYQAPPTEGFTPTIGRVTNFQAVASVGVDAKVNSLFAFRFDVENRLIRYRTTDDPPGRGAPPRLSFLSHENYVNSTNWGVRMGPVLRF